MEASTRAAPQLRPLGVGEVLDAAFKIYTARFKPLVLCVLVPTAPLAIVQVLLVLSVDESAFDPTSPSQASGDRGGTALGAFAIAILLNNLAFWAAAAACIRVVAGAYLDTDVTWRESLRFGLRRMLPVLGLAFLIGFVSTITLVLLFLGVFLFIRWGVTIPARIVEDARWFSSLGRSWKLVGGRWWATFALYLILVVMLFVASFVVGFIFGIPAGIVDSRIAALVANVVSNVAASAIVLPLAAAVITIHYLDLRVRKEGLDLEVLAERMGTSAPAGVAHGSGLGAEPPANPQWQTGEQTYGGFSAPRPEEPDTRA